MTQDHSIWSTTVQNYAQLRFQRGPKWSQMVENSQNSIKNLLKEKKVSVTHGKKGIWPQKPNLREVFGVKWPLFDLQRPFFFPEDVENQVRKLIGGRKVGVTNEKMGIWPQKWWNLSQKVDDKPSYHLERWKTTKVSSQLVVRWFNRKLIGGRKVDVTHEKMVTNNSESEVRSQGGPKWVKSSPW